MDGYESAWRTPGTHGLATLFSEDATYLHSPYAEPVVGLAQIRNMWDEERDGADEVFTIGSEIVAVEGDTAVVRAVVRYGDPIRQEYTDLWVLRMNKTHAVHLVRGVALLARTTLVGSGSVKRRTMTL